MRYRDWYFQGWERRTDDNGKKTFVYTGEYYTFPAGLRAERRFCLLLSALLVCVYAFVALLPAAGGMWRIAAIPQLLELIPIIYLLVGLVCLLAAKEPLTYRDWYASWRRMGRMSVVSSVFTGAMAVIQLVYLILYARESVGRELLYLLGELVSFGLSLSLAVHIRKHPCTQSISSAEAE